jgi:hypothetical protein
MDSRDAGANVGFATLVWLGSLSDIVQTAVSFGLRGKSQTWAQCSLTHNFELGRRIYGQPRWRITTTQPSRRMRGCPLEHGGMHAIGRIVAVEKGLPPF